MSDQHLTSLEELTAHFDAILIKYPDGHTETVKEYLPKYIANKFAELLEVLHDHRRELRSNLTLLQNHIGRCANLLGCDGIDSAVEQAIKDLIAENDRLKIEVHDHDHSRQHAIEGRVEALAANERDRTRLHQVLRGIDEEITGRMWLLDGRGSYEWDDDNYRQEFGWAVKALQDKLEPLRRIASDLKNSPTTQEAVEAARAAGWISAATPPKGKALCCGPVGGIFIAKYDGGGYQVEENGDTFAFAYEPISGQTRKFMYWMPIADPPKGVV